jgi:flagellar FliJ protein
MHTLLLLLKHAEANRDAALADCQLATQALQAADRQLEQLVGYRRDYESRWNAQFSQLGRIELVRCYHEFMGRLSQAVDQQDQAVQLAAARKDAALRALRECELRVASVGKLIERRSREIRLGAERREQKHFDEMAARMARNGPFGPNFMATQ